MTQPDSEWQVFHNPRCSKSRSACALLQEKGIDYQVVEYLKTPPSKEALRAVLAKLGMKPVEIVRTGEAVYKDTYKGKTLDDEAWLDALVDNPVLIERPIVIRGDRAVVGRPPERVLDLL